MQITDTSSRPVERQCHERLCWKMTWPSNRVQSYMQWPTAGITRQTN